MKPHVFAALALAVLFTACNRESRLLKTEPTMSDVAGRYTWSDSAFGKSVDSEILSNATGAYIELNTNGGVLFHKVPIVSQSRTTVIEEFRSGSGTFEISAMGSTARNNIYGLFLHVGN